MNQLGQIIVLVLIGCGPGVLVNLCIAPPPRYRSAEHGVQVLAGRIETLLDDMADGRCTGDVDADRAAKWRRAGESAQRAVWQARAGLHTAESSLPLNPRRLLPAHRSYLSFERYRQNVDALERAVHQLGSLTRSLGRWRETEDTYTHAPALTAYADFAGSLRDIAQEALRKLLGAAQDNNLPVSDASLPYGVLVVEATRLMEEFQNTCDALKDTVEG